jgi:hypothetical protein
LLIKRNCRNYIRAGAAAVSLFGSAAAKRERTAVKYTTDKREPAARLNFWKRGKKRKRRSGGAKMRRARRDGEIKIMRVTTD